jgi:MoaA/NifB/PqqE/SkfB family radical SAM enzyme
VSLHSHIPEVSDKLTKCSGGFERTIAGMMNLEKYGFSFSVYHVINSNNYMHLQDFVKFMKKEFPGVHSIALSFLFPKGMVLENPGLIPRFSDVKPHLYKALGFLEKNSYKFNFATCGVIPLCFMEGYEDLIVYQIEMDNISAEIFDDAGHVKYKLGSKDWHDKTKVKSSICRYCDYEKICPGLWSIYAEKYGTDEMKPMKFDDKNDTLVKLNKKNFSEKINKMKMNNKLFYIDFSEDDKNWKNDVINQLNDNKIMFIPYEKKDSSRDFSNFFPVTFDCNNNCISCPVPRKEQRKNPSYRQLIKSVDTILKKSDNIELNGGEPTLRNDLIKLLHYIVSKGKRFYLYTNCERFCYEDYASSICKICSNNNMKIVTTLYGHNSKLHDTITRTPGSFDRKIEGIRNLVKNRAKIELRILLHKMNYRHFDDIINFITKNFNADSFENIVVMNPKLTCNAAENRDAVMEKISKIAGVLKEPVLRLSGSGFNVSLFHFPQCVLDGKLWKFSKGVTAADSSIFFPSSCNTCEEKRKCSGIWKSYYSFIGGDEFVPISNSNSVKKESKESRLV